MKYEPGRFERIGERFGKAKATIFRKADSNVITRNILKGLSFVGRIIHKVIIVVVNTVTLTIVYFIGLGISFAITKIFKKDIGFGKENHTWKPINEKKDEESYLKQF